MPLQRSFEQLGRPLGEVSFCVIDLETTGGSPDDCAITEIGAATVCRGEVTGTFHTLVDPGQPVPAFVRLLTGISDQMLIEAPSIESVLPSLLEFLGDSVVVAHNARFDVGFIDAALRRGAYERLRNQVIDTAKLARKILAGEVSNHKLSTLARHLRCAHQPTHRAFADVLATVDVLHHLIERVAGYGVTTLEDLVAISSARMDGTFHKIRLTEELPRATGIYRFIGSEGNTLYVGKATDIRSRVRSYFHGDPRRRIKDLLREAHSIEAEQHPTLLEAEIAEIRAIAREQPPYNRVGKKNRAWYLKVDVRAKTPRVAPARVPKDDGAMYLGPFDSMKTVRVLLDAVRDTARIHRCTDPKRCRECPFQDIGTCAGSQGSAQRSELRIIASALAGHPAPALNALAARMTKLARMERFEEAAELRSRGELLERSLRSGLAAQALVAAGDIVLALGRRAVLVRNAEIVARAWIGPGAERVVVDKLRAAAPTGRQLPFLTTGQQREAKVIASWVLRSTEPVRLLFVERPLALPAGAGPSNLFGIRGRPSNKEG